MLKPRTDWDTEDLLDYLEGWHAECDVGFSVQRSAARRVAFVDPSAVCPKFPRLQSAPAQLRHAIAVWATANTMAHQSDVLIALGREDRIAHRLATGI